MHLDAVCPAGHRLIAPAYHAGQQVACPVCKRLLQLPELVTSHQVVDGTAETGEMQSGAWHDAEVVSHSFELSPKTAQIKKSPAQLAEERRPPTLLTSEVKWVATTVAPVIDTLAVNESTSGAHPQLGPGRPVSPLNGSVQSGKSPAKSPKPSPLQASPLAKALRYNQRDRVVLRRLVLTISAVALLSILPVIWGRHWNLSSAPLWSRVVLSLAVLQLGYGFWMWRAPTWRGVWLAMVVFATMTSLYALGLFLVWNESGRPPAQRLGLETESGFAIWWCSLMLWVSCMVTMACARATYYWHKRGLIGPNIH